MADIQFCFHVYPSGLGNRHLQQGSEEFHGYGVIRFVYLSCLIDGRINSFIAQIDIIGEGFYKTVCLVYE